VQGRQLVLAVNDRDAAYPVTIDPIITSQEAKLTAGDGAQGDQFGWSVSLSGDGNTALVGARLDDTTAGMNAGSAYVFVRNGNAWSQQAKLTADDGATNDAFGTSISVSRDGNTALVGAHMHDTTMGTDAGSAYVFVRNGNAWSQQAKLTASDGAHLAFFGWSVSVSGDGNTVMVGADQSDRSPTKQDTGSAYVFVRSGSAWSQQAQLTASDGEMDDHFGYSVSLSGDGTTALVGAHWGRATPGLSAGSAYVFERSGSGWSQQAKLTASDGAQGDQFGDSVSLSGNGNTALVGADRDATTMGTAAGSAYVFVRNGNAWSQQAHLTASDGAALHQFGYSVSASRDGNTALVGRAGGGAYVFVRNGDAWSQQARLTASDSAAVGSFGCSVSVSEDASAALVGACRDGLPVGIQLGSAYVVRFPELVQDYNRQTAALLAGGAVRLTYLGLPGTNYVLDRTFDLTPIVIWTPQATNAADSGGSVVFTNAPRPTNNYWRVRASTSSSK